ncbi:MAG: hypothetical protein JJE21_11010, partial [Spirochaetaceae bacterium]|nr:hypothetical protein [Spirochaetaceae bacterium]
MDKIKRIIGIDVYKDHYDACFQEIDGNKINYYTGSSTSDYGKQRLMARIDEYDMIIISESMFAAILSLRFVDRVKIVNNNFITIISKADVERGKKMATFFTNNLVNKKDDKLSDKMINNLLVAGEQRVNECERLNDLSQELISKISRDESVDFSDVLDLEEGGRIYNS